MAHHRINLVLNVLAMPGLFALYLLPLGRIVQAASTDCSEDATEAISQEEDFSQAFDQNQTLLFFLQMAKAKRSLPLDHSLEPGSCEFLRSCHDYKKGAPCQCNSKCHKYNNCCSDFEKVCNSSSITGPITNASRDNSHKLRLPSGGYLYTFYAYRAQSYSNYPLLNVNAASLGGVLWYLQNEILPYCYTRPEGGTYGYRRFNKTRIKRYKIMMRATTPLLERGMNFGSRVAFDSGKNTGGRGYETYGYVVGCNKIGDGPFPICPSAQGKSEGYCPIMYGDEALWYSFPGQCPSHDWKSKSSQCKKLEPGGYCTGIPTGTGNCTWTYEDAGDVSIDSLSGISGKFKSHADFCQQGCIEYDKFGTRTKKDHGNCGVSFWDQQMDYQKNQWRIRRLDEAFKKKYPNLPSDQQLPPPKCDFDYHKFYDGLLPEGP